MKKLLMGLMLLMVSGAASAEWELIRSGDRVSVYMEKASIRRNGNFVKVWDLFNWKSVQKKNGDSYLSEKSQAEYDCTEERMRQLIFIRMDEAMGGGQVVNSVTDTSAWIPIVPLSIGEKIWKIACGKK